MLRLIIANPAGDIREIREIIPGSAILNVMDNVGKELWDHIRITLWCDENGNMGEREYNNPTGGYDVERVTTWARNNVMTLIEERKKIQAIKRLRDAWPLMRLRQAKELVESITPYRVYN